LVVKALRGNGDGRLASAGIDGFAGVAHAPLQMNELAALTDLQLPPVTDVFRGADLDTLEERVVRAERAVTEARYDEAVTALSEAVVAPAQYPDLALRALFAGSWARMYLGELDEALALLRTAKEVAHRPGFNDVDRAEVLHRIGCVRVRRGSIGRAVSDFTLALELCERTDRPCDRLRADIFEWRSRCFERQRDFDSARADIERSLELADATSDVRAAADVNFRAAGIAQSEGKTLLARFYAEKARDLYDECGDRSNVGRVLNDLGGIMFLLGDHDAAISHLKHAVSVLFDAAGDVESGYAVSSLAQVYLRTGQHGRAEQQARIALKLLGTREDVRDEIGNVQLVLGRALLEQGVADDAEIAFAAAEEAFAGRESVSRLAAAWMARGELASARGDMSGAADLYRRAAEALQDFHF
jgi:tetratricopeptide (TPR) repeat protein